MSDCLHTKTELKFFENFTHYNICKDCGKYLTDDEHGLFKRIAELEAKLAAAESDIARHVEQANEYMRDAERYRWIRRKQFGPADTWDLLDDTAQGDVSLKCEGELDAAIDSARSAK